MKNHDLTELVGILLVVLGVLAGIGAAALVHVALAVLVASIALIFAGIITVYVALNAERASGDPTP